MKYTVAHWCPVCDGKGGWDKFTYKPRFREENDTSETYMWCVWCGPGNIIPITDRG